MRPLKSEEIHKRGCIYCLDCKRERVEKEYKTSKMMRVCTHDTCPYHELDIYNSYDAYLKYHRDAGVEELLGSVFKMQRDL